MPAGILTSMKLVNPANGEVQQIYPGSNGLYLMSFDLGFPAVRVVSELNPEANGATDTTAYHGTRAVSLNLKMIGDGLTAAALYQLRKWLAPGLRPVLLFALSDGVERQMNLRANDFSSPMSTRAIQLSDVEVQMQWECPDGVQYGTAEHSESVAVSAGALAGRSYPLDPPRDYPDATGNGTITITPQGTAQIYPVIRIYGPCTGPALALENVDPALTRTMAFEFLTIDVGDFIEIDTAKKTVRFNGLSGATNNYRRWMSTRQWWSLTPGMFNLIRFTASDGNAPSQAVITYHDAWL